MTADALQGDAHVGSPTSDGDQRRHVLADGGICLTVDASAGPRITSLSGSDGAELLAVLEPPEVAGPDGGPQALLHGGHRLWAAPEVPEVTYRMADGPCQLVVDGDVVTARDAGRPLSRELAVALEDGTARVRHIIRNQGDRPLTVGPWALTQVPPDGTAVLPIGGAARDPHELQATGSVVIWPYTDLSDSRYTFHRQWISLTGGSRTADTDPTKIGVDGFVPWIAHAAGPNLLIIISSPRPDRGDFADLGATRQMFTQRRFTELESVGPLTAIAPGDQSVLEQVWVVRPNPSPEGPLDLDAVVATAEAAVEDLMG